VGVSRRSEAFLKELAQFVTAPPRTPYVVFLILSALGLIGPVLGMG
jgi:hypothetical protein